MKRVFLTMCEFCADPLNILIFLFLWVGVALMEAHAPKDIWLLLAELMGAPAILGYLIGRRRK
jgi:hypothetical protein